MALTIKVRESTMGIANGSNPGPAAQYRGPEGFMSTSDKMLAPALMDMARGLDTVSGALYQKALNKQQYDLVNLTLQAEQDYAAHLDDVRQNRQGADAFNAEKDFMDFNREYAARTLGPWKGNARVSAYLTQHIGGIASRTLGGIREHSNNEQKKYEAQTYQSVYEHGMAQAAQDPLNWQQHMKGAEEMYAHMNRGAPPGYVALGVDKIREDAALEVFNRAVEAGELDTAEEIYRSGLGTMRMNVAAAGGQPTGGSGQPSGSGGAHPVNLPKGSEAYLGLANNASAEYGVPTDVIMAVMQTESRFQPGAVSPTGVKGLMQVTQKTYEGLGFTGDRSDPQNSVRAGTKLLGQLYAQYGNWEEALAAYNGGPDAVHGLRTGDWGIWAGNAAKQREIKNYAPTVMKNRQAMGGLAPDKGQGDKPVMLASADMPGDTATDAGGMAPAEAEAEPLAQSAVEAAGEGAGRQAPGAYSSVISPKNQAFMRSSLDKAKAARNKEFKAQAQMLPGLAQDEAAMIIDTGRDNPALLERFQALEALELLPEGSTAKYEAEKEKAYEARAWVTDPINLGLPYPEQIARARTELAPDAERDAEGYRAKKEFQGMVVTELERQYKALNDDPAGFLSAQVDKTLKKEAALGYLNPEDKAAVFKARAAVTRRLAADAGMGLAGLEKIALSKRQVDEYSQILNQAKNPQERLTILSQLDHEFGTEAGAAFNQLGVGFHEVLAAQAFSTGDPRLGRAAQLAVNRPPKLTNIKAAALEVLVRDAVDDTDYGELLTGRVSNSGGLDPDAGQKQEGLREFAAGVAASLIESGASEKEAAKEIKYALDAMFGGAAAINTEYANIYLTPDSNGETGDKESVLNGLNTLSQQFGDDFYWINDGDDSFVLTSRLTGRQETFDGSRSVRVSRGDAAYVGTRGHNIAGTPLGGSGGAPLGDVARGAGTGNKEERDKRAAEVISRMRATPPVDEHSLFIEAVRANTVKDFGNRRPNPAAFGVSADDDE
ncbi:MAG: transglycosylase SLT domain-containing protein [Candidatus Adiutrix sp.]|jgi:soluble lytic murein transglycosylase-like protein|nr:transglycosylase SLT domain-containing protein [Candidatus Adiutrix sp.]